MLTEQEFQQRAAEVLDDLEERLSGLSEELEFDVEAGGGMLTLSFEEPAPARFILSPNTPARQIWVSARSTSFKFDWDDTAQSFVLDRTREPFLTVIRDLLAKQLGKNINL